MPPQDISPPQRKAGFVALVGRPNSGKSTLLNAVLQAKVSIVTPKAQTTRERVLGILTEKRGQLVFVDTPGIHRAKEGGINAFMMNEAEQALSGTDVVWYLLDPDSEITHEKPVIDRVLASQSAVILLLNKSDLLNAPLRAEKATKVEAAVHAALMSGGARCVAAIRISAKNEDGVLALLDRTWDLVPQGHLFYDDEDQLSDKPTRYFVSEKIREQLLLQLDEEIPYSCGVEIERFDESTKPPRIEATIFVERDSQKGIVIGKAGQKIRSIGAAARKEVEDFLGGHVFLGLKVKVLHEWTRDPELMKRLGYIAPKKRGARS